MNAEAKLRQMQLELPPAPQPVGDYVPALRSGHLVYTAGQLPSRDGRLLAAGKVPTDVPVELARQAARQACLNGLAAIKAAAGSLDAIVRVVRLNVFVNSAAGFTDQAQVANGASELLVEIFGEAGKHTRCALGAAELPPHAPVELDLVAEIEA